MNPEKLPSPSPGLAQALKSLETVNRFELDNGLIILHQKDSRAPLLRLQVFVKTGSIHEGEWLGCGLSHFLEHMLFKGTDDLSGEELAEGPARLGASMNAYTSYDTTSYYIDLPAEHLHKGIYYLCQMCLHSTFPSSEIDREKDVILREIDMYQDDPDSVLYDHFMEQAFRVHPYRYPIIGYKELFAKNTRDQLEKYYADYYTPNNMILVVVGDCTRLQLERSLRSTFEKNPRGNTPLPPPGAEPVQLSQRELLRGSEYEITRSLWGFRNFCFTDKRTPSLTALSLMLGMGPAARLRQKLVEELKLVDSIYCGNWSPFGGGLFNIGFNSTPERWRDAEEALLVLLQKTKNSPVEEREINSIRRSMLLGEWQKMQSLGGIARTLAAGERIAGNPAFIGQYLRRMEALNAEDVEEISAEFFKEDELTKASLLPGKLIQKKKLKVRKSLTRQTEFRSRTLPNGIRLHWLHDPGIPKAHLAISTAGGQILPFEKNLAGLNALTFRMLRRDTMQRSAQEVDLALARLGTSLQMMSSFYRNSLSMEVLSEDLPDGLQLLSEAVQEPAFRRTSLEKEKNITLGKIVEIKEDPREDCLRLFRQHFFAEHPFGLDPLGSAKTLSNFKPKQLKAAWDQQLKCAGIEATLVGGFDPDNDLSQLEASLSRFSKVENQPPTPKLEWTPQNPAVHHEKKTEQSVVILAFPNGGTKTYDPLFLNLLDQLFNGLGSNLFKEIREKRGLAYYVSSIPFNGVNFGAYALYAGCSHDKRSIVLEELRNEVNRIISDPLPDREFEMILNQFKASVSRMTLSHSSMFNFLADRLQFGLSVPGFGELRDYPNSVTPQYIQKKARELFPMEKGFTFTYGQ